MASIRGGRPLNRSRGELNRRSSRRKRIFFEVPVAKADVVGCRREARWPARPVPLTGMARRLR